MLIVFLLSFGLFASLAAWIGQHALARVYARYRLAFNTEAQAHSRDFFIFIDPAALWWVNILACVGAVIIAYLLSRHMVLAVGAGLLALLLPRILTAHLRKRRLGRLDEQLPDLVLALAGALRAGSGIQPALRHLVDLAPNPMAQELGLVLRQQRMGMSLDEALAAFNRRMPTEGAGLLVSALNIAMQSGGNLAETLEGIAVTLRARLQLAARVQALTAQGRLQAWAMALLPAVLAAVLDRLDPDSMALLWHTPAGWAVLSVVLALEFAGILFIRRIIDIQI